MDRVQLLLLGLPLLLFCSDVVTIFAPPPPSAAKPPRPHHQQPPLTTTTAFPAYPLTAASAIQEQPLVGGAGYGNTVEIKFCASCSYRGNAVTMKKMIETSFPGINVILENYPPPLPKRLLGKLVPVVQVGAFGIMMAGDQIFPRFGIVPPPWFYQLRANRFGTMASIWLFGNFARSFLQSSGAFEVHCNSVQVFSKLAEQRFPSEYELRELIGARLTDSQFVSNPGAVWSQ